MKEKTQEILLALPMFLQDGLDKYNGVMRYLSERKLRWNIRFDRLAPNWDQPVADEIGDFDGIIVDGLTPKEKKLLCARSRLPLVALDWFDAAICRGRARFAAIDSDSSEIGRLAAKTLLDIGGFATYAFLPQPDNPCWSTDRGTAFVRFMKSRHVAVKELGGEAPLVRQLRDLPKPAAVFAAHDTIAAQAIREARRAGIAIPEDLSVLGVDNERLTCLHTDPPLATIQPDFERAGYLAAQALDRLLHGRSVRRSQMYHVRTTILRRSLEPAGTAGRLVQRALELINDHALEYRTIDELANALDISRRLLDRRFRQIVGRSVLDVIQDKRLESVCTLLKTTELPISEICASCSFGSGTYPLRLFKARMGMTMRAYRLASHT